MRVFVVVSAASHSRLSPNPSNWRSERAAMNNLENYFICVAALNAGLFSPVIRAEDLEGGGFRALTVERARVNALTQWT